jgi:release factor glutamine methyltransferase
MPWFLRGEIEYLPQIVRNSVTTTYDGPNVLGRATLRPTRSRRMMRAAIHFFSYHFILNRQRTTLANVAGFRLIVRPMVFHPRYFLTSAFFARFLLKLDLSGKRVADVGTGSGILALAAAQAGAASVLALDINPNAAQAAAENAHANGFGGSIRAVGSNLLSAVTPRPLFDVILSSPPSFAGEPRDFAQARERLASDGRMYLLLSTDSDLGLLGNLINRAGFAARLLADHSILIESFLLYELTVHSASSIPLTRNPAADK